MAGLLSFYMLRPVALIICLAANACARHETRAPVTATDPADAEFKAARFDEAQRLYAQIAERNPSDALAAQRIGALALFHNRLDEAEPMLLRARALDSASTVVAALLAEVYVRRNAFPSAVPLVRAAGRDSRARQLESFGTEPPYVQEGPDEAVVPFLAVDPLPIIEARGPDGSPLTLFIDTGAGELVLDTRTAARLGARSFGDRMGTVAGGQHVSVGRGSLASITLGPLTVRRLPVDIDDLAPLTETFGGRHIDGIVGTTFLYHFVATLDYPGKRLVLRRRAGATNTCAGPSVPFLLAGDHFILARGGIGRLQDMVWLVDSGLADGGFSAPESTLQSAGITLDPKRAERGIGEDTEIPFVVPELSLGPITARNVAGVFAGDFPVGRMLGFRVDGLVSHTFLKPYAVTFDFEHMLLCFQH